MLPNHTKDFEALAKQLEVGVPLQKAAARLLKYPWYFEQAANQSTQTASAYHLIPQPVSLVVSMVVSMDSLGLPPAAYV